MDPVAVMTYLVNIQKISNIHNTVLNYKHVTWAKRLFPPSECQRREFYRPDEIPDVKIKYIRACKVLITYLAKVGFHSSSHKK